MKKIPAFLTLAACGGGQSTTPVYLTAVSAQCSPTLNGLPITGATITVQK